MRPTALPLVLALAFTLASVVLGPIAGCGGSSGELHGSICSVYDCSYNTVSIRNVSDPQEPITTVQVDFTDGPVNETVERAAVVVCDVSSFVKGEPLPATDVRRVGVDQIGFPTLKQATCTFSTDLAVGGQVSGEFQAVFTTEMGTDRALYGNFEGPLQETGI